MRWRDPSEWIEAQEQTDEPLTPADLIESAHHWLNLCTTVPAVDEAAQPVAGPYPPPPIRRAPPNTALCQGSGARVRATGFSPRLRPASGTIGAVSSRTGIAEPELPVPPLGLCVYKACLTVRYGDHEETVEAGQAFFLLPGRAPAADAGTEFVQFSPVGPLAATTDAIMKAMS
jgi:hypothetical protein